MRLTLETLSTLIWAHSMKVFGAENGEWVSEYFMILPGFRELRPGIISFMLLSSPPPPMTMQSAWTLWPVWQAKPGNQMRQEAATLGAVRHERCARSPAKTCTHIDTHSNGSPFQSNITFFFFALTVWFSYFTWFFSSLAEARGDTLVPALCCCGSTCLKYSRAASVQPSAHPGPSRTRCALGRTSTAREPKYVESVKHVFSLT